MNRTVTFETELDETSYWIEAEVTVRDTGLMYNDQDGGFGPVTWDHEFDHLAVFTAQGTEVSEKLEPDTRKKILDEIEERLAASI